jgi:hypothetical protein
MTGALMAVAAAGGPTGYTGSAGTIAWGNVNAVSGGSTNLVTLSGITGALTIAASNSGGSQLYYTLNDVNQLYSGPFAWPEGQALGWYLIGSGAGTITVTSDGATIDSFTYLIVPPGIVSLGEIE